MALPEGLWGAPSQARAMWAHSFLGAPRADLLWGKREVLETEVGPSCTEDVPLEARA